MALHDPLAVYNAATNAEAQLIRNLLTEAGIEAFAVEDVSQVGTWALGLIPELHKPQVWVDRGNAEQARFFIEGYERQAQARGSNGADDLFCYECGEPVKSGQSSCPACGKALDWSEDSKDAGPEGWGKEEDVRAGAEQLGPVNAPGSVETLRALKKPFAWIFLTPILLMFAALAVGVLMVLIANVFK